MKSTILELSNLQNVRFQGKSQVVQDELVRLGEQMVTSSKGTRALALELFREFEDRFLQHITTGEWCSDLPLLWWRKLEAFHLSQFPSWLYIWKVKYRKRSILF